MIMRYITRIFVAIVALVIVAGCFKEERQGTRLLVELWSKNVESEEATKTVSEIEGYAFYIKKGSKWSVETWEDALDRRITNTENPSEQLTTPDVIADYDTQSEYQLSYELWDAEQTFLVVVDKTNRVYATRSYETPMNLPVTYTQLHLYAYKKSGPANGWDMVNPFPDDAREPLVPTGETEEGGDDTDGTEEGANDNV